MLNIGTENYISSDWPITVNPYFFLKIYLGFFVGLRKGRKKVQY